jgi:hypothetical protein
LVTDIPPGGEEFARPHTPKTWFWSRGPNWTRSAENRRLRREAGDREALRRIRSDSGEGRIFTREELAEPFPEADPLPGAYRLHLPSDSLTENEP